MYQIDVPSAATTQPASTSAGTTGYFTDGNPATGIAATIVPAEFLNAIMMELLNTITAAGLTPNKAQFNQLATAVKAMSQAGVAVFGTDTGSANAYVVAYTPAVISLVDGMVLRFKAKTANTGASTFNPNGTGAKPIIGLAHAALQGGEIAANGDVWVQWNSSIGGGSWILVASSGGATQCAPAVQSQHAVQFGQIPGVVGQARNLAINVASAQATATVTADEVVVESALGGLRYCLPNFSKTINLGTTGAGGMDTGTAPANGFVALYAIYNPTTGASALLGVNATSVRAPEVYGGANMPAGYTASALVSVAPISATTGQFAPFLQVDRDIFINQFTVFNSSAAGPASYTPISLSAAIPLNARAVQVIWSVQQVSAGGGVSMSIACNSSGFLSLGVQSVTTGGTAAQSFTARLPIIVAQTLYYMTNVVAASRNAVISAYQI